MTQQMYSIREAAVELQLETHVLRYWEEELGLPIARNAQGRRIYSGENLEVFRRIKSWKEQGLQLKAIRSMLTEGDPKTRFEQTFQEESSKEERKSHIIMYRQKGDTYGSFVPKKENELYSVAAEHTAAERQEKARRLQELLKQFVIESVRESNAELLETIKEGLFKELDYQFRLQEEREEERERLRSEKEDEHFRELDENLRNVVERKGRRKKRLFASKK